MALVNNVTTDSNLIVMTVTAEEAASKSVVPWVLQIAKSGALPKLLTDTVKVILNLPGLENYTGREYGPRLHFLNGVAEVTRRDAIFYQGYYPVQVEEETENLILTVQDAEILRDFITNTLPGPISSYAPLETENLAFGDVVANSASADLTLTVTNIGSGTLVVNSATSSTNYSVISGASHSLAIGESGVITVRFTPTTIAVINGTLNITGTEVINVTLTGTGT